jgi:hypothetical protein
MGGCQDGKEHGKGEGYRHAARHPDTRTGASLLAESKDNDLLAFNAIGLFAGLRVSEIRALETWISPGDSSTSAR